MSEPQRIQRLRTKGWKAPPNTIMVTRPGKFGNPWAPKKVGDLWVIVCSKCEATGDFTYATKEAALAGAVQAFRVDIHLRHVCAPSMDAIKTLRGKNIGCYCGKGQACHGDVLLKIANEGD